MIARHSLIYVGSRGFAAGLNMASVAVFTRLAPVESYGTYLYVVSWALVLYGATCQWPKFAFFALYDEARAPAQVGTVVRILGGTLLLAGFGSVLAVALGLVSAATATAILALAFGTTLFEGATEIARTRLQAGAVAASVMSRAVLILGLGSLALHLSADPLHLAFAVAAANAVAALPAAATIAPMMPGRGSRAEALRLFAYGWPLVLSFGTAALAQSLDRLIIAKTVGPAGLGAYGALADFLRQSFIVFGEAIALSLISIAKREARAGDMSGGLRGPERRRPRHDADRGLRGGVLPGLRRRRRHDPARTGLPRRGAPLAPVLILASILMMFRAYYFGQVIYFTRSSRLEAAAAFATLVAVAALSLLLIPRLGATGAALAFAGGQSAACLVLVFGAGRAGTTMPLPLADMAGIAGIALACAAVNAGIGLVPGGLMVPGQILRLVLLAASAGAAAWRYDVLGFAGAIRHRLAT